MFLKSIESRKKIFAIVFSILLFVVLIFLSTGYSKKGTGIFYIRINQLGFLPEDLKTGIILSNSEMVYKKFDVVNIDSNKTVYSDIIKNAAGDWGDYKFNYIIDFSPVKEKGNYVVEIDGKKSFKFRIAKNLYNELADSLLKFFRVQRCGPTDPFLHAVCHLYDVPLVIGDTSVTQVDVTGGWHDAGDYIKFLTTSAYTTYLLLFTYEFHKDKFEFDHNKNGVPDILEEAKVGIDWMLRCNYKKGKLITQVMDKRDHEVAWRLPEDDPLKYERTAYVGMGKNQIGMFAAVMSLASRIWKERFSDNVFSKKCLDAAIDLYSIRDKVPDVDSNQSGMYQDKNYLGKLALGAIELYNTTHQQNYLDDAVFYGDKAKSDYWWSWGDINSLADYRIAKYIPRFGEYLENNLRKFNENKNNSVFGEGSSFTWGSTNTFFGIALQAILWKDLTGGNEYDSLCVFQRDYILGKNPWGLSFIYKIGTSYPKNLHSQVAYFKNGYLPGAVTAGPAPKVLLDNYKIKRENFRYNLFNSADVLYFDDRNDYITNEPTIVCNATALFVTGYYFSKK
jgi:hypothetical protein